jgi:hypothetical protein
MVKMRIEYRMGWIEWGGSLFADRPMSSIVKNAVCPRGFPAFIASKHGLPTQPSEIQNYESSLVPLK